MSLKSKCSALFISASSVLITESSDNKDKNGIKQAQSTKNSSSSNPKTKYEKKLARFHKFASVERCFDGYGRLTVDVGKQLSCYRFMNPRNFLDSMCLVAPEQQSPQKSREENPENDLFANKLSTYPKQKDRFLTHFNNDGLINFTDYLFLLSILSKSNHKLNLAFELLDYNGDNSIDKHEFQELEKLIAGNSPDIPRAKISDKNLLRTVFFGQDFEETLDFPKFLRISNVIREEILRKEFEILKQVEENSLKNQEMVTIGDDEHDNLNLDIENNGDLENDVKNNIGENHILPESFAKSILRHTNLPKDEREMRTAHIKELYKEKYESYIISFEEYRDFSQFLFALEDIAKVLKFVEKGQQEEEKGDEDDDSDSDSNSNQALGLPPHKFQLAVKVATGINLSERSISILYDLLDIDGDGSISYNEIIGIFKNRLDRSLKSYLDEDTMGFKRCLFYVGYQRRIAGQ